MKHGKKYVDSAKLIDTLNAYDPEEAVALAIQTSKAKFDETIEIHARLGVDPVTLTSRFVAPLFCPTAPAAPFACWL